MSRSARTRQITQTDEIWNGTVMTLGWGRRGAEEVVGLSRFGDVALRPTISQVSSGATAKRPAKGSGRVMPAICP